MLGFTPFSPTYQCAGHGQPPPEPPTLRCTTPTKSARTADLNAEGGPERQRRANYKDMASRSAVDRASKARMSEATDGRSRAGATGARSACRSGPRPRPKFPGIPAITVARNRKSGASRRRAPAPKQKVTRSLGGARNQDTDVVWYPARIGPSPGAARKHKSSALRPSPGGRGENHCQSPICFCRCSRRSCASSDNVAIGRASSRSRPISSSVSSQYP